MANSSKYDWKEKLGGNKQAPQTWPGLSKPQGAQPSAGMGSNWNFGNWKPGAAQGLGGLQFTQKPAVHGGGLPSVQMPAVQGGNILPTGKPGNTAIGVSGSGYQNGGYTESDAVRKAQAAYQQQAAGKPGAYQSQWQGQMDEILSQIQDRKPFQYDMNADALYQQYKDMYIQQGKQAMMDAMGQAAAMTGGYGSSYGQQVGQQTYQGHLQQLNNMIPELYQLALNKYQMEGQDLYDRYGMYADRENQDYGRYRDSVNDYNTERDRLYDQYVNERNFDYGKYSDDRQFDYTKYVDDRNYNYQVSRDQVADKQWQDSFDYQKSRDQVADDQWNKNFEYQQGRDQVADQQWQDSFDYQKDRDQVADNRWQTEFEYQQSQDQIANDQWNQSFEYQQNRDQVSDDQWNQSFEYQQGRDEVADQQWQAAYDEDKRRYDQEWAAEHPEGGSGSSSGHTGIPALDYGVRGEPDNPTGPSGLPEATKTANTDKVINGMMTQSEAKSRGISDKEYTAMVEDRINHSNLSDGEVRYLLQHYGLE